ncbi:MAG: molybdopterin molybdotransferase MoeA, partial [Gammaproteobacteria bacterium]|nr:molybdopterin molybdotransferase MoeA [Gammaproteobacteria bacterium]
MHNNEIEMQPSCEDELNEGLLTVAEAQARILDGVTAISGTETLPVREALDRVLSGEIVSPINVPSHTNSAMDGYAVRAGDLPADGVREFPVPGTSWAGRPWLTPIEPGQAVQIMTGGMLPEGADTVVMQEQVERNGDTVRIGSGHKPGQHVRAAGEDLVAGQPVFTAGKRLTAADIGVLASLGLGEVSVTRRLKVAFFSTGDELRSVGEPLDPGEIYDSNRYTLYGMLKKLDVEIIDMGVVRDRRELIEQAFIDDAARADAIIT